MSIIHRQRKRSRVVRLHLWPEEAVVVESPSLPIRLVDSSYARGQLRRHAVLPAFWDFNPALLEPRLRRIRLSVAAAFAFARGASNATPGECAWPTFPFRRHDTTGPGCQHVSWPNFPDASCRKPRSRMGRPALNERQAMPPHLTLRSVNRRGLPSTPAAIQELSSSSLSHPLYLNHGERDPQPGHGRHVRQD